MQGELAHAQARDEEDGNSIENRLLLVERSVYDQSIQVELLEDRMTADFNDMRNSTTRQFDEMHRLSIN